MELCMKIVSLQLNYSKQMLVFTKKTELISHLNSLRSKEKTVGFVPTMGALHEGHLSLLKQALQQNDVVVISIFVNPTQFNNPDDLAKYPRSLSEDMDKIKSVSESIILFTPTVDEIYNGNTTVEHFDFDGLEFQMEGKFRPGHFDGVGTIVKCFFEIILPTNAYFGEKDFQQLRIIQKMVEKHAIPVSVVPCPVFREPNGLAMSSRNERLSEQERSDAAIIYKTISEAKNIFPTHTIAEIKEYVSMHIHTIPSFELEYFEIAEEATLIPIMHKDSTKKYRAFIAVFVNNIRFIDTISLN